MGTGSARLSYRRLVWPPEEVDEGQSSPPKEDVVKTGWSWWGKRWTHKCRVTSGHSIIRGELCHVYLHWPQTWRTHFWSLSKSLGVVHLLVGKGKSVTFAQSSSNHRDDPDWSVDLDRVSCRVICATTQVWHWKCTYPQWCNGRPSIPWCQMRQDQLGILEAGS